MRILSTIFIVFSVLLSYKNGYLRVLNNKNKKKMRLCSEVIREESSEKNVK